MAQISRPPKAAGNTNYVDEVAEGKLDIIDAEIDLDFNTLYNAVNALDSGVITGPIPCSALALAGCITTADIESLDAAKLYGSLPHTVGGVFVHGGSLINETVQAPALVPGITIHGYGEQYKTVGEIQSGSTPIANYLSIPIAVRTNLKPILCYVAIQGTVAFTNSAGVPHSKVGIGIHVDGGLVYQLVNDLSGGAIGTTVNVPYSFAWPFLRGLAAGNHTISVNIYQPGPDFTNNIVTSGSLIAVALT